jgi:superfamily II DNA or RNA helicase
MPVNIEASKNNHLAAGGGAVSYNQDLRVQNMSDDYNRFLASKVPRPDLRGMKSVPKLSSHLFPFQKHCVEFLLTVGSGGLFLDTGLGKTLVQLEYAEHARQASNGRALILTPLAVAKQIEREGKKFGYDACVIRDQSEAREGINICNYDRLHLLDVSAFGAVTLDEASILKSFNGKTSKGLIDAFDHHVWRMPATATPAPNDHMEMGQYSDFCGIMKSNEMLSRFFVNDTAQASQKWVLKQYGIESFWDWVASWCRLASMPSDLGGDDTGYVLPPIEIIRHRAAESAPTVTGGLFGDETVNATNLHTIKRATSSKRAGIAAALATSSSDPYVVWVDTDYESQAVMDLIGKSDDVVEIRGSMDADKKERAIEQFGDGSKRVLITKPSLTGFGLNWQHCARTVFVGRSFSYESWYQAVRRFWRFGQKREVQVHLVVAEGEDSIARVIDRKADDHDGMKVAMRAAMKRNNGTTSGVRVAYEAKKKGKLPSWIA